MTVSPDHEMAERIDKARFAVATARLQLARLLGHALAHCEGLTDESQIAQDTFKAVAGLDDSFPSKTDVATGLPLTPRNLGDGRKGVEP